MTRKITSEMFENKPEQAIQTLWNKHKSTISMDTDYSVMKSRPSCRSLPKNIMKITEKKANAGRISYKIKSSCESRQSYSNNLGRRVVEFEIYYETR